MPSNPFWLLGILAVIVIASGLGLRDPWPSDEPRFALIAKEIVSSGNWWFPTRGGDVYAEKPPIFLWISAFFYSLIGDIRWSFLLPSICASFGTLALTVDLTRRLWNKKTAFWAGIILLTLLQFVAQSKRSQIDALLCFWTTLSIYGLARHLLDGPAWRWYGIAGIATGLGILTKGVGFLPFLGFLIFLVMRPFLLPNLFIEKTWRWTIAPIAILSVLILWAIPVLTMTFWTGDPDQFHYVKTLLFKQTATRYFAAWHHIKPWHYYLSNVIPWAWFPFSLLLPWLTILWINRIRHQDPRILFFISMILAMLIFFSVSTGKRGVYLLPTSAPLAILIASVLPIWWNYQWLHKIANYLKFGLLIGLVIGLIYLLGIRFDLLEGSKGLANFTVICSIILFLGISYFFIKRFSFLNAPLTFAMHIWAFWILISVAISPSINDIRSGKEMMQAVVEAAPNEKIAILDWREQMLLHAQQPVFHFGYNRPKTEELTVGIHWMHQNPRDALLMPEKYWLRCKEIQLCTGQELHKNIGYFHRQQWTLVQLKPDDSFHQDYSVVVMRGIDL